MIKYNLKIIYKKKYKYGQTYMEFHFKYSIFIKYFIFFLYNRNIPIIK